jgi:hypothetical protein
VFEPEPGLGGVAQPMVRHRQERPVPGPAGAAGAATVGL